MRQTLVITLIITTATLLVVGCTPKVEVAVPNEPITINMNVKIEHEIRVKLDKELDHVLSDQSGLF